MNQDDVIDLASKIDKLLMDLSRTERSRVAKLDLPADDFAYAEAILLWKRDGSPSKGAFITADPYLLEFRKELVAEFGLPLLTPDEKARVVEPIIDKVASGIPEVSAKTQPEEALRQLNTLWAEVKVRKDGWHIN